MSALQTALQACNAHIAEWHSTLRNFERVEPPSLKLARAAVAMKSEPEVNYLDLANDVAAVTVALQELMSEEPFKTGDARHYLQIFESQQDWTEFCSAAGQAFNVVFAHIFPEYHEGCIGLYVEAVWQSYIAVRERDEICAVELPDGDDFNAMAKKVHELVFDTDDPNDR